MKKASAKTAVLLMVIFLLVSAFPVLGAPEEISDFSGTWMITSGDFGGLSAEITLTQTPGGDEDYDSLTGSLRFKGRESTVHGQAFVILGNSAFNLTYETRSADPYGPAYGWEISATLQADGTIEGVFEEEDTNKGAPWALAYSFTGTRTAVETPAAPSVGVISLQVGNASMTIDGVNREIDPGKGTAPVLSGGRVFLPIRSIVEAMGGTIGWTEAEKKVPIKLGSTSIELWIGKNIARVNGQDKALDASPFISAAGRTMLPLRFVIESLGCQAQWDDATQGVTIATGNNSPADFSGAWNLTVDGEAGHKLTLTQNGNVVTGYSGYDAESGHGFSGTVTGKNLTGKFRTTNPVTEWVFEATMAAGGNSFDGLEYYSNPAWVVHGEKAGTGSSQGPAVTPSATPAETIADFAGIWKMNVNGEDMGDDCCLVLAQNGNQVSGYFGYDAESGHGFSGTVTGKKLTGKFRTTNPVTEWDFVVTMASDGNSFSGIEYYSNPPWDVYGVIKSR